MDVFGLSLLRYHCSDALVAMGQMPVAIVIYAPLPQCLFVVVETCMQAGGGLSRDVSGGRKKWVNQPWRKAVHGILGSHPPSEAGYPRVHPSVSVQSIAPTAEDPNWILTP
jgi:hypothetical protein